MFESPGLQSLNKLGWALFAIIFFSFVSSLWLRSPTQLPPPDDPIEEKSNELESAEVGQLDVDVEEPKSNVITFEEEEPVELVEDEEPGEVAVKAVED